MKGSLSDSQRRILAVLQDGMPMTLTPYADMAARAGMETGELIAVLRRWKKEGKLRRIGAVVDHFKAGMGAGAMVVWMVEPRRVAEAAGILAGFRQASHVYERNTAEGWPYNLYTMVHASNIEQLRKTVEEMSRACEISNFRMLITDKELKKTPPMYITR